MAPHELEPLLGDSKPQMASWTPVSYKIPKFAAKAHLMGSITKAIACQSPSYVGYLIFVILEILKIVHRHTIPHHVSHYSWHSAPALAQCTPT